MFDSSGGSTAWIWLLTFCPILKRLKIILGKLYYKIIKSRKEWLCFQTWKKTQVIMTKCKQLQFCERSEGALQQPEPPGLGLEWIEPSGLHLRWNSKKWCFLALHTQVYFVPVIQQWQFDQTLRSDTVMCCRTALRGPWGLGTWSLSCLFRQCSSGLGFGWRL